jgi:RIO kinase 1
MDEKDKIDEEVFKQAYIPRNLEEVYDVDRDADVVARGDGKDVRICKLISDSRHPTLLTNFYVQCS